MIFQRFAGHPGLFGPFSGLWAGIGPRSAWFRGIPRGFPGGVTGGPPGEAEKPGFASNTRNVPVTPGDWHGDWPREVTQKAKTDSCFSTSPGKPEFPRPKTSKGPKKKKFLRKEALLKDFNSQKE